MTSVKIEIMRNIHHSKKWTIDGATHCDICKKPFLMYFYDAAEKNGQSDTTSRKDEKVVHYNCIGGKSLKQINDERKLISKHSKK